MFVKFSWSNNIAALTDSRQTELATEYQNFPAMKSELGVAVVGQDPEQTHGHGPTEAAK